MFKLHIDNASLLKGLQLGRIAGGGLMAHDPLPPMQQRVLSGDHGNDDEWDLEDEEDETGALPDRTQFSEPEPNATSPKFSTLTRFFPWNLYSSRAETEAETEVRLLLMMIFNFLLTFWQKKTSEGPNGASGYLGTLVNDIRNAASQFHSFMERLRVGEAASPDSNTARDMSPVARGDADVHTTPLESEDESTDDSQ